MSSFKGKCLISNRRNAYGIPLLRGERHKLVMTHWLCNHFGYKPTGGMSGTKKCSSSLSHLSQKPIRHYDITLSYHILGNMHLQTSFSGEHTNNLQISLYFVIIMLPLPLILGYL
jgi:hypothetical protein